MSLPSLSFQWILLQGQSVRYILIGILNTAFSFGCYSLFIFLGLTVPIASLIALVLGVFFSFVTQGTLVFRNASGVALIKFIVTWAMMYCLHVLIVQSLMSYGINPYLGGVVAMCVTTVISFFLMRDFVFRIHSSAGKAADIRS